MDEAIRRKMKEKKYIDINKALRNIEHYIFLKERGYGDTTVTLDEVAGLLLEIGTADVVEVRHGEWINKIGLYECSACGKTCPYDVQADVISYWECRYCPNCGAKMDEERMKQG